MEVLVLNVDQDVDEKRLRQAIATRVHRPPFRRRYDEPEINFDVHVHINEGVARAEWEAHRGTASLTFPEYWQGKMFLERHGEAEGFQLMGKKLHFSQSERRPAEGLIESLRRLPWLPPKDLEAREATLDKLSTHTLVRQLDFGRPCRDGVFSIEHSVDFGSHPALLTFDAQFLLVRIATPAKVMTFRCDTVTEIVADEKANAMLVVLKMAPSFEEQATMMGDPQDKLDEIAERIPEVMPPPTKSTKPSPQIAQPKPVPGAAKGKGAAKPPRSVPGMPKKSPSPTNNRVVPGLHKIAPVKAKVTGWGDEPVASTSKPAPQRPPHALSPERPVVPGVPTFNNRPPPEQTAYARAAGGGPAAYPPGLAPPEETSWPIGIQPRYVQGKKSGVMEDLFGADMTREGSGDQPVASGSGTVLAELDGNAEDMSLGVETTDWRNQKSVPRLPTNSKGLRLRTGRYDEKHKNTAPFTSRTMRIVFDEADAIITFENKAELTWTGFPAAQRASVPTASRHIYSHKNRSKILAWLKTLPVWLAMQIDALYLNSVLDPLELLQLEKPIAKHLKTIEENNLREAIRTLGENVLNEDKQAGVWGAKINLVDMLENAVERVRKEKNILPIHSYMVKTFHLYITPSCMSLEGPYPSETNRIVRRYRNHTECFLRVTFCDESRREYRWERNIDWPTFLRQRVGKVLLEGVVVAGRTFSFLGYSMSSLRMRSAWFVTPFEQNGNEITAESIRQSLGDFSKVIKAPSRYGARIAQAFTATRPSLRLRPEQIKREPDIIDDNGHCFTDGAARLSPQLAKEILQATGDAFGPSPTEDAYAFQFRLGGAKGVAAIDTNLADQGSVIYLRPSTEKFDAPTSLDFEVVLVIWQCRPLTLSQDIIQILEDRGVRTDVFLRMQESALNEAKGKRTSLSGAAGLLTYNEFGEAFDVPVLLQRLSRLLPHDEFDTFAQECEGSGAFLQHCLRNAFASICRNLKYKSRLPVPGGCLVVGTADETRSLGEREIYCCVTPFGGLPKYYKGKVLVFRSPAVHPGDAQMLTAIGEPPEEHKAFFEARRNQIVFSVVGTRPLASELGGGDLDGDPFGITDYAELFPPEDADPAEYPPVTPSQLDRDATWQDVVDWVVTYIGSDVLGLLGSRRRLIADQCRSGTKHPRSLKLAELYTAAVGAPKSGILPPLDEIPRRLFKLTPDFMQPEDLDQAQRDHLHLRRYYESSRALGKLFRAIPRAITSKEPWVPPILPTDEDGTNPDDIDFERDEPVTEALKKALRAAGLSNEEPEVSDLAYAGRLHARYARELRHIATDNSLGRDLSEPELIMGLIAGPSTATSGKQKDVVEKAQTQAAELRRSIYKQLLEPRIVSIPPLAKPSVPEEQSTISEEAPMSTSEAHQPVINGEDMPDEQKVDALREQGRRAWAAWCVGSRAPIENFGTRSFSLIALGALMDAIAAADQRKKEKAARQMKEEVARAKEAEEANARRLAKGKDKAVEMLDEDSLEPEKPYATQQDRVAEVGEY